jgi:hypothetical protein
MRQKRARHRAALLHLGKNMRNRALQVAATAAAILFSAPFATAHELWTLIGDADADADSANRRPRRGE